MPSPSHASSAQIARIVRQCLESGGEVEIDGLGAFRRTRSGEFTFVPGIRPKVFLAYALEDRPAVERLCDALAAARFDPWMDCLKLLPGQNWSRAIERAIAISDFFVACFSSRSIGKRGCFQSELRYALACAAKQPLEDIFFIPVRLEACRVPSRVADEFQYVDLFPDWDAGFRHLLTAARRQFHARTSVPPPARRPAIESRARRKVSAYRPVSS